MISPADTNQAPHNRNVKDSKTYRKRFSIAFFKKINNYKQINKTVILLMQLSARWFNILYFPPESYFTMMLIKAVKQFLKIKLSFHLFPLILMLTPHQHNHLVTNTLQCFSARGREEFFRGADNLPEKNRLPTSVLTIK